MPTKPELVHPADQLVAMMTRIYRNDLTTTSGGNLSIRDENEDIWITPTSIDKGRLTRSDICQVKPDGTVIGQHRPSVELPFHQAIYRARPDLHAIVHAHPSALVAFAISGVTPNTRLVADAWRVCGQVAMAQYALPGSQQLVGNVVAQFTSGFDIVLLENHGVVVGASNLENAYLKCETCESTARIEILARRLAKPVSASDEDLELSLTPEQSTMEEFSSGQRCAEETEARRNLLAFVRRAYQKGLFSSGQGAYSVRLSDDSFLITPCGTSPESIDEDDLVLVRNGQTERGKTPSDRVFLHKAVYDQHLGVRSAVCANPPHAMAFAVTDEPFDPRTIPESYIILRNIGKIPFAGFHPVRADVVAQISGNRPAVVCQNDTILVTGTSLVNAFDRLEVMEATAHSIIDARAIGAVAHISGRQILDIENAYPLA